MMLDSNPQIVSDNESEDSTLSHQESPNRKVLLIGSHDTDSSESEIGDGQEVFESYGIESGVALDDDDTPEHSFDIVVSDNADPSSVQELTEPIIGQFTLAIHDVHSNITTINNDTISAVASERTNLVPSKLRAAARATLDQSLPRNVLSVSHWDAGASYRNDDKFDFLSNWSSEENESKPRPYSTPNVIISPTQSLDGPSTVDNTSTKNNGVSSIGTIVADNLERLLGMDEEASVKECIESINGDTSAYHAQTNQDTLWGSNEILEISEQRMSHHFEEEDKIENDNYQQNIDSEYSYSRREEDRVQEESLLKTEEGINGSFNAEFNTISYDSQANIDNITAIEKDYDCKIETLSVDPRIEAALSVIRMDIERNKKIIEV
jgi:hypothetical protein